MTPAKPKLLDRMRGIMRTAHYSPRTEDAYLMWARQFIVFHGKRHPREMGEAEVSAFNLVPKLRAWERNFVRGSCASW